MTQPGQSGSTFGQRAPQTSPAAGGFFNRPGFLGGLFAGFLGAGLLGMLFGNGLMGGLGGAASMLGLPLQTHRSDSARCSVRVIQGNKGFAGHVDQEAGARRWWLRHACRQTTKDEGKWRSDDHCGISSTGRSTMSASVINARASSRA
jgi:hypothetical protein